MIWLALITIFVLFVLFASMGGPIYKRFGFKVCAICAAVSLTWIGLLTAKLSGWQIDTLLLGILMGESITGIMYLFENIAKKKGKSNLLWLKVIIILLGTLTVYLFLAKDITLELISAIVISIVFAIVVYFSLKRKKSKKIPNKKYGKFKKEIKELEEKFEHCCD